MMFEKQMENFNYDVLLKQLIKLLKVTIDNKDPITIQEICNTFIQVDHTDLYNLFVNFSINKIPIIHSINNNDRMAHRLIDINEFMTYENKNISEWTKYFESEA